MIDAVIFDLGGVLIDWNPRYLYRKIFAGNEERMEYFLTHVANHHWNERQDAGRLFSEAVAELSTQYPEFKDEICAYQERWHEMLKGPIHETVQILKELQEAGVALYALTNWSAETFPVAQQRFDFLSWFKDVGLSGAEKMKKPDPRFYQLLLKRNHLQPERCLFIDDVQVNVEGARAVGLQSLQFTGAENLRKDLVVRKILR
jgi:2-haloacid dehalogenase